MTHQFPVSGLVATVLGLFTLVASAQDTLRLGIMQAQRGEAAKYAPLVAYLDGKGIKAELVGMADYSDAARKFAAGELDAMFSGSGVAAVMMLKGLATPLVRTVTAAGHSTYWAVVVAPTGSPDFTGKADYFKGKRVICCALASSGEFFLRSLYAGQKPDAEILIAGNHGDAVKALARGEADVAIVKNRVFDSMAKDPANAELLKAVKSAGRDAGENPDNTLIVSTRTGGGFKNKLSEVLTGLATDAAASEVKTAMAIEKFIPTTDADFASTIQLVKAAGVTADFNFTFE